MNPHYHDTLQLNPATLQLGGPHGWVDITDAECALLRALALSGTARLENAELLARVGKAIDEAAKHALEVRIVRLRKKLEQAGAIAPTIKAIRGFGYQLCVPLAVSPAPTFVEAGPPPFPSLV
jgi:DNA-binding response OmpR family regulator